MALKQFDMVIRMAAERRDEAAQRLSNARAAMRTAENQAHQLEEYQRVYIQQHQQESSRGGMTAHCLAEFRRFIRELNDLVHAQQDRVTTHEREVEALVDVWCEASHYLQALEKLVALRKNKEQLALEKREQQRLDDLFVQYRMLS